jgi:hypothetical protein
VEWYIDGRRDLRSHQSRLEANIAEPRGGKKKQRRKEKKERGRDGSWVTQSFLTTKVVCELCRVFPFFFSMLAGKVVGDDWLVGIGGD